MGRTRRIFTRDFKIETVNQLLAGKPVKQVARENDLHPTLIRRWKREYADYPEKAFSGHGNAYCKLQAGQQVGPFGPEALSYSKWLNRITRTTLHAFKRM